MNKLALFDKTLEYTEFLPFSANDDLYELAELLVSDAKDSIPQTQKLHFIYKPIGTKSIIDPFGQTGHMGWKYSPYPQASTLTGKKDMHFRLDCYFQKLWKIPTPKPFNYIKNWTKK